MLKRILKIIFNILLVILPFSGILMPFAPAKGNYNFNQFLFASLAFSVIIIMLTILLERGLSGKQYVSSKNIRYASWLLILSGITFTIPLSMDAPPPADIWLQTASQEKFRFSMLLLATICFGFAAYFIVREFAIDAGKLALITGVVVLIGVAISCWDYYSLLMVDKEIAAWTQSGKDINEFFLNYDFKESTRAIGRISIYCSSLLLSILIFQRRFFALWQCITFCLFCIIGIFFCGIFLLKGPAFYFPFMVPAVALAPGYWIGIILIRRKQTS